MPFLRISVIFMLQLYRADLKGLSCCWFLARQEPMDLHGPFTTGLVSPCLVSGELMVGAVIKVIRADIYFWCWVRVCGDSAPVSQLTGLSGFLCVSGFLLCSNNTNKSWRLTIWNVWWVLVSALLCESSPDLVLTPARPDCHSRTNSSSFCWWMFGCQNFYFSILREGLCHCRRPTSGSSSGSSSVNGSIWKTPADPGLGPETDYMTRLL